jgi:hypothetical protein
MLVKCRQTVRYVSTDRLILNLTHQRQMADSIRFEDISGYAALYTGFLGWTKDPTQCQVAKILKVYQILMYRILRVGTHLIHICSLLSTKFSLLGTYYVNFFLFSFNAWHANPPMAHR